MTYTPGTHITIRAYGLHYPATVVRVKRTGALVVTFTTKAGVEKTRTITPDNIRYEVVTEPRLVPPR